METIHLGLFLMLCVGVHASSSVILKRQKRNWIIDSFSIDEGYNGVYPYVLGNVDVQKDFPFFNIHGQGVEEEPKGVLQIDRLTGVITVHRPVDFEKYQIIKLTFEALDRESHAVDMQLGIDILIIDADDNIPTFDHDIYETRIKEATSQGTDLITVRATDDDRSKKYELFDLQIVSVHPEPSDLEFDITQLVLTGTISFKGCLDHETADKYTIIVEAKGNEEGRQLSSSSTVIVNIEDGNNHLPVITGQTGSGRVKEGEENVLVKRLQVADKDSKGTAAWRAKFKIQGKTNNHFRITTDPETNEGLLYVEKHLDYEDGHIQNVTISVENEIPYSSCKVVRRSNTGLWEVNTETETLGTTTHQFTVSLFVEDVNEPPIFHPPKKQVTVVENVEAGKHLVTFTARDPDGAGANAVVYKKGDDPADWVSVDPKTGKINTTKIIDRESVFVKDNVYTVTILSVDNGQPPLTGTGTLEILITDENDNAPNLAASNIDMCQSDGLSLANITCVDPDEEPYGGPFTFRLRDQKKGKWKLDPLQGYSVNLVKEPTVPSGQHKLLLEVIDRQGEISAHKLSVNVCNCKDPARPNCRIRKASTSFGGGGIGAALLVMLLLAGVLLLALLLSCKRDMPSMAFEDTKQHLMLSNIEKPGTDCELFEPLNRGSGQMTALSVVSNGQAKLGMAPTQISTDQRDNLNQVVSNGQPKLGMAPTQISTDQRDNLNQSTGASRMINLQRSSMRGVSARRSMRGVSARRSMRGVSARSSMHGVSTRSSMHGVSTRSSMRGVSTRSSMRGAWNGRSGYSAYQENNVFNSAMLLKILNKKLSNLEAQGEELGDYAPHVYAEEGDAGANFEPDAFSIPDISFDPDLVLNLDSKFNRLASICMPSGSAAHRTKPPPQ